MGEPAAAHLVVQPSILERGQTTEIAVELPRLREGEPPVRLDVQAARTEVLSTRRQNVLPDGQARFTARLQTDAPPGRLAAVLRARFPGGEVVEIETAFVVVPAPASGGPPLLAIGVGAALAVGLAGAALLLARRRKP